MKKVALLLICGMLMGSAASAQTNLSVNLNGNAMTFEQDQQPMIKNDKTYVPVRKIFESFGMDVDWDSDTKTICANNDETEVTMSIDNNEMWVNGKCIQLDAQPFLDGDRAFVPIRAISEALNCVVNWNGIFGLITIIGGDGCVVLPTLKPTIAPTTAPTIAPTTTPSTVPTVAPTTAPTTVPTIAPTTTPTTIPTIAPTTAPTQAPSTNSAMEQEVLKLVNAERAKNGLSALSWAEDLAKVSRAHSQDMISRSFFSHTNPDGQSPFDRLRSNGISYRTAAENIAYGQKTAAAVMNGWMNSSGHRQNILNKNVKEIGVGAVKNQSGTVYWTQMFVAR